MGADGARPGSLRQQRGFVLYSSGVVLSEIGDKGTFTANLFHVYALTGSVAQTGLIGLARAVALLVLSPLGGAYADRLDRRRLLQYSQAASLAAVLALTVTTVTGTVRPWHVMLSVLLNSAAATFDRPARHALVSSLVERDQLVKAFAIIVPRRELASLVAPVLAGVLIQVGGPALMYVVDAVSFIALIVILRFIRTAPVEGTARTRRIASDIGEGFRYVRRRPIILQLIGLDLSASLFGAYRVVLPALAVDVLRVGGAGYGLLGAAPAAGALLGSALAFRSSGRVVPGRLLLGGTIGYGLAVIGLGQAPTLPLALAAAMAIGAGDAMTTTVRTAAVQLEVPDAIRGRVTAVYQMASRGGPALGDLNVGWIAGLIGPAAALTAGGLVPIAAAVAAAVLVPRLRGYDPAATREQPAMPDLS